MTSGIMVASCGILMRRAQSFLHTKLGIIHRDVKPSNIMMSRSGAIKLCDLGVSGECVSVMMCCVRE